MRLVERAEGWVVEEWAWGRAALLLVIAAVALVVHLVTRGSFGLDYPPGVWRSGWFVAAHALVAMALFSVVQRRWRFDFARRELWIESRGLWPRRRRIPFGDLRRLGVPVRPVQDEGQRYGMLVLAHAHGVERFRDWAKPEDHAEVAGIAARLGARLGLHPVDDDALVRELLANGKANDAIEALSLYGDRSLMDARLEVQRRGGRSGAAVSHLDLIRETLRTLTVGQALLLVLFLPLFLLVILFGRARKRPPPAA